MSVRCKTIKRKRSKRKKLFVALLIIGAIIAAVCIFIKSNVNPMIVTISNERIRALTTDAVSSSVLDVMSENSSVDYLKVTRDDKQNIKSVDMNTAAINDLAQKITLSAQKRINEIGNDGIKIPVGSLSGVTLFTGLGPDINIKIYLVGSTQTQIISMFTSAGINQTLHRLYINIAGSVAVAVPRASVHYKNVYASIDERNDYSRGSAAYVLALFDGGRHARSRRKITENCD